MTRIPERIRVIDSHTGGEPTRLVVGGFPDLGGGPLAGRLARFRDGFDHLRSAIVREPRGHEAMVGALLCEPSTPDCSAAVIFFNNVGYLSMCGHGMIGLISSLAFAGRIEPGDHRIETVAGVVTAHLFRDGRVSVENVASYRFAQDIELETRRHGIVRGDIAWGGNWFFLVRGDAVRISMDRLADLTEFADDVRWSLASKSITGKGGAEIDHIELFEPSAAADSRNFVLCPGGQYDRSPCGTGTSAKLACLYADGRLAPGEVWRQESVTGSVFEGTIRLDGDAVIPTVTGTAFVTAEGELLFDPEDPFRYGLPTGPASSGGLSE